MIAGAADQPFEAMFRFEPPAGELLPSVELLVLGLRARTLAEMAEAWLARRRECYDDSQPLPPMPTVAPYQVLQIMLDQREEASVARAGLRVAAARAAGVRLIVLAALGASLCNTVGPLAAACDCTLVSERPEGLLHLLRLLLPPPQQVIGYDMVDVMTVWRGGFGRVVALPKADGPPSVLADLAAESPDPRGATVLLEEYDVEPRRLPRLERRVDRVRSIIGAKADLLWAYNQMPAALGDIEVALVWDMSSALTAGVRR